MGDQELPEDVLIEILIRLLVKYIVKLRCVCRTWRDLVKSHIFIHRYQNRERKQSLMLLKCRLTEEDGGETILSFHQPDFLELLVSPNLTIPVFNDIHPIAYTDAQILGPCNGLVCIPHDEIILLCNPALREFKWLPRLNIPCAEGYVFGVVEFGFGFDPNTGAYKIVQISHVTETDLGTINYDSYLRIDLYDSASNSWRHIDAELTMRISPRSFEIFLNGNLHWCVGNAFEPQYILFFDISMETTQLLNFPDDIDDSEGMPGLMVLNESLAMAGYEYWSQAPKSNEINIWVMKEYGVKESGTKQYVIGPYILVSPLLFWKNEWLLIQSDDGQSVVCALHENQFKRLPFCGCRWSYMSAVVYEESLISLDDIISDDCENP